MNPIVKSLLEFNEAFEIPKLDSPGLGTDEMIELRIKLLREEVEEYAEAARAGDMVEVLDPIEVHPLRTRLIEMCETGPLSPDCGTRYQNYASGR